MWFKDCDSVSGDILLMGRSLAEELGTNRLTRWDIGLDVTGYVKNDTKKECVGFNPEGDNICNGQGLCKRHEDQRTCRNKLPNGHRYFHDCCREQNARCIHWMMGLKDYESWFVTLTFKTFISENRARQLLKSWLYSLTDAYKSTVGEIDRGHGLLWVVAQEWQARHVIHFHLLISGVRLGSLSRMRWESRWSAMRYVIATKEYKPCGFARIYEGSKKAAPYLAKYVGKTDDHGNALEWGGSWQGITAPDSLRCCKA